MFLDVGSTAKNSNQDAQSTGILWDYCALQCWIACLHHYPSLLGELRPSPTHWFSVHFEKNQTQKPSLNWSAFWPTKSNPLSPRLVKPSDANWLIFKAWRNALRPSLCDWHLLCLRGRALLGERPWLMEWMVKDHKGVCKTLRRLGT